MSRKSMAFQTILRVDDGIVVDAKDLMAAQLEVLVEKLEELVVAELLQHHSNPRQ